MEMHPRNAESTFGHMWCPMVSLRNSNENTFGSLFSLRRSDAVTRISAIRTKGALCCPMMSLRTPCGFRIQKAWKRTNTMRNPRLRSSDVLCGTLGMLSELMKPYGARWCPEGNHMIFCVRKHWNAPLQCEIHGVVLMKPYDALRCPEGNHLIFWFRKHWNAPLQCEIHCGVHRMTHAVV